MPEKFLKPYDHTAVEGPIYKKWEDSGYFNPDNLPVRLDAQGKPMPQETFSIILPPPNVTGTLHLGHAYEDALQDTVVRFKRMLGYKTLWVPGADSAAIATQSKVETNLYKEEGKTRYDIGRDELMERIKKFTEESKNTILNQVRRMGSSLDWSRFAYTLDETRNKAVNEAFVRMFNADLIYRGERIVNWDPRMQTTISDDEIEHKEQVDPFYYFQYGPFVIGTVRPETKFGDKYVVMHPNDKRYAQYTHGQKIELEWINGPITATVIKDEAGDMEFGSGVMTITPAHSGVDFEIAQRHKLDFEPVIDSKGKLLPIAGEFAGMHIKKARPLIVEKLKEKGLLVKIDEKYTHNVAVNSRGGEMIEPQLKFQWFVDVNKEFVIPDSEIPGIESGSTTTLKKLMRAAVEHKGMVILPDHFEKIYYHWIDNLRDWCISRQIWFGHRIPVWYRGEEASVGKPGEGEGWEQDPDTLDTWFSSGLWPMSTLGWPEETSDLKTYFPNSMMAPGYEILFFWVARMVLMCGFLRGAIPFKTVFLHGIVRDKNGKKFSKSMGNGIDPLDMIEKYGTDALRMSLLVGAAAGSDIKFDEARVKGYKLFANKLWNITRFVFDNASDASADAPFTLKDAERATQFKALALDVTKDLEEYRLYMAAEKLYHYLWDIFAADMIEESKPIFKTGTPEEAASRKRLLMEILRDSLKLLHPFMPFITEEIWSSLPDSKEMLMVEAWPVRY
ncbi:MAG TPA: valine--tRNA ligase [Candidatus Paceibacterota bacterium]|nr:valine--tRNA ligase [Candidatus Paceibacterota bacterium]